MTSQDLARAEKSKFVELHHLWWGLIQNKKSSAGVILDKLKIQAKDINLPEIIDKSSYYEVALSKSTKKFLILLEFNNGCSIKRRLEPVFNFIESNFLTIK